MQDWLLLSLWRHFEETQVLWWPLLQTVGIRVQISIQSISTCSAKTHSRCSLWIKVNDGSSPGIPCFGRRSSCHWSRSGCSSSVRRTQALSKVSTSHVYRQVNRISLWPVCLYSFQVFHWRKVRCHVSRSSNTTDNLHWRQLHGCRRLCLGCSDYCWVNSFNCCYRHNRRRLWTVSYFILGCHSWSNQLLVVIVISIDHHLNSPVLQETHKKEYEEALKNDNGLKSTHTNEGHDVYKTFGSLIPCLSRSRSKIPQEVEQRTRSKSKDDIRRPSIVMGWDADQSLGLQVRESNVLSPSNRSKTSTRAKKWTRVIIVIHCLHRLKDSSLVCFERRCSFDMKMSAHILK